MILLLSLELITLFQSDKYVPYFVSHSYEKNDKKQFKIF